MDIVSRLKAAQRTLEVMALVQMDNFSVEYENTMQWLREIIPEVEKIDPYPYLLMFHHK